MDRTKLRKNLLRLLGPIILVVVIAKMPDRAAVKDAILGADPLYVALASLLNFFQLELKVWRWDLLLRTRGIRYPSARARVAYYASMYAGMITPGRVGDVVRVQYLRADLGTPYAEGVASIVMDRLCDLYVLAGFVVLAAVRYESALAGESKLRFLTWALVAGTFLGPLVLLVPGVPERVAKIAFKKFASSQAGFAQFLEAMRANVGKPLLFTLPLTVVAFLINYLQGWLIAKSLHLDLAFVDVACLMAIASLLSFLPISVSGVGVRELLFALILPTLGHTREEGVGFGLVVFVAMYLVCILAGFVVWTARPPPDAPAPRPAAP